MSQFLKAIKNLWKQELFSDVNITPLIKLVDDKIFLKINVEERPRLSRYNFRGIRKSEAQELKNKLNLVKAKVVTEAAKKESIVRIKNYFEDKGYGNTQVKIREKNGFCLLLIQSFCLLTLKWVKEQKSTKSIFRVMTSASESRLKRALKKHKRIR